MGLTREQHDILLRPLNGSRVQSRKQAGRSLSFLEAWDVKAHLTRIFGFCNWDGEILDSNLAFETAPQGEAKNWSVGYKVTYRITVRDQNGEFLCTHAEAAVGSAQLPQRGEAHDMAIKTAESDALKRAAINLGTQFGLSLYNNGSTHDIIKATIVTPTGHVGDAGKPEKAPVSDEQPEQGSEEGTTVSPSLDVITLVAELSGYVGQQNRERIMSVAKFKARNKEALQYAVDVDGQQITLARYADLVASGAYEEEGQNA